MKVSIVTPVYNDTRVGRALDSILAQRFDGEVESIVIDGGSGEETLAVLERYRPSLGLFISERDRGIYDAMNKGILRATGDIVGILNADDRYHDELVLRHVCDAFQDPAVQAVYGDLVYVNGDDQCVRYWRSGVYRRWKFYLGWMPPHPTFFVRRSLYERYGVFKLEFPVAADYEIVLRFLLKHKVRAAYIPRVLVCMSMGGNSNKSLRNIARGNREVLQAWRQNGLAFGYLAPVLKPASKVMQYVRRPPQAVGVP
jgi:glycosyltransferase